MQNDEGRIEDREHQFMFVKNLFRTNDLETHRATPNNITESILDIFRNVSIFYQQSAYIEDQNKRFHRQSVNYYLYFHSHIILYTSILFHSSQFTVHTQTRSHIFYYFSYQFVNFVLIY